MQNVPQLASGLVLDGRYRVDELISVGGMGAIYAGTHTFLKKKVAIKVLRNDLPAANLMIDRFQREAIAASAIGHENIVQVTDMGVTSDGIAYLVMELLTGRSLGAAIKTEAPMPIGHATRFACEILRGLGAAHRAGIVHRDLKPDNVFLVKRERGEIVKLLDFGVSLLKRPDLPDTRLTTSGTIIGTPRYMSPEQARGEIDITGGADVYAAGVVLYEMLTGVLPYPADHYNVIVHQIISGEWLPLDSRRTDLPLDLVHAVHRALALQPEDRFSTADDFAETIDAFADESPRERHSSVKRLPRGEEIEPTRELAAPDRPVPTPSRPSPSRETPGRQLSASESLTREPAWASGSREVPRLHTQGRESEDGLFAVDEHDARPRRRRSRWPLFLTAVILAGAASYVAVRYRPFLRRKAAELSQREAPPSSTSPGAVPVPPAPPDARPTGPPDAAAVAAPAPAPAPPTKPAPAPAPAPAKPKNVTIELIVVPPRATVEIDGKPSASRRLVLPRDTKALRVRVSAPGYATQSVRVVPSRDQGVVVQLKRNEPPAGEEPPPTTP